MYLILLRALYMNCRTFILHSITYISYDNPLNLHVGYLFQIFREVSEHHQKKDFFQKFLRFRRIGTPFLQGPYRSKIQAGISRIWRERRWCKIYLCTLVIICANDISPAFSDPMVVLGVSGHVQKNLCLFQKKGRKGNASAFRGKK